MNVLLLVCVCEDMKAFYRLLGFLKASVYSINGLVICLRNYQVSSVPEAPF